MTKVIFILSLIVLIGCSGNNSSISDKTQPNILFIMVDDLGKEWISHYGAEDISTPNIDALAESGMSFSNVYSMPQCTPSRVTLLTGQYPFRHGWVNHWDVPRWGGGAHFDETMNPSLGIEMKTAGYSTCVAGKWQIDDFRVEPDAMTRNGFDEFCMWTGYEAGIAESAKRYQDPYLFTKDGSKTYQGKFGPDVFKDFIIDFIRLKKKEPMFIYYPMVLTHTPFVNTPIDSSETRIGKHKAMVKYVDLITGEIIEALEEAGLRENTVVIWTTDNGTSRRIVGKRNGISVEGGKAKTIETGINEPFIVSWPEKIAPSSKSDALIDFSDIFPTCLDLAGIEPPTKMQIGSRFAKIDGRSFKNVLLGAESKGSQREWILGMGGGNNARRTKSGIENQYLFRDRVVRNKRFKLYINSKREAEKFVDIIADPQERTNIKDSLNTEDRKKNFISLLKVIDSFPEVDNDPVYKANHERPWDVDITAESKIWKVK